nr:HAD domain-containing protein [Paenibacillus sp. HWE-109]
MVNVTGAKIIISSSWREGRTLSQLQSIFRANGIEDCVIGVTPSFNNETIRGAGINAYLDDCNDVDSFVIIDDEEKMGDLEPFLVETDFRTGITESVKIEVIRRLMMNPTG